MSRFVEILNSCGPELNIEKLPALLRELQGRRRDESSGEPTSDD